MMKNLTKMLALAGFLCASYGFTNAAHAETIVARIDNELSPHFAGAASAGTILVRVYFKDGSISAAQPRVMNTTSNTNDFTFNLGAKVYANIAYINVSMSDGAGSSDLFIIDKFTVIKGDGSTGYVNGANNEFGFCITDTLSQGSDVHCKDSIAYRSFDFHVGG